MYILELLKKVNWTGFLKGPLFILVVAVGAFVAGKHFSPVQTKIVTVDKVTEVRHEVQTVQQQINIDQIIKQIQQSVKSVDRTVVKEVITQKDGSKVERETDTSHSDQTKVSETNQETKVQEISEIKKFLDSYKQEEKIHIVEKLKAPNPWRVGVQIGYGKDAGIIPTAPNWLLLGVSAERNLIGSLNAGVWANTQKAGGLQLSVGF